MENIYYDYTNDYILFGVFELFSTKLRLLRPLATQTQRLRSLQALASLLRAFH